jgi:hypothetical protein
MSAGQYAVQLRRGLRRRGRSQLYVKRRTAKRGGPRVLVSLPASVRYALCVWGSHRANQRAQAVSQELCEVMWDGLRARLGEDADLVLEQAYERYAKQCAEAGQPNIFEAVEQ